MTINRDQYFMLASQKHLQNKVTMPSDFRKVPHNFIIKINFHTTVSDYRMDFNHSHLDDVSSRTLLTKKKFNQYTTSNLCETNALLPGK
jgi:hypothetical protein